MRPRPGTSITSNKEFCLSPRRTVERIVAPTSPEERTAFPTTAGSNFESGLTPLRCGGDGPGGQRARDIEGWYAVQRHICEEVRALFHDTECGYPKLVRPLLESGSRLFGLGKARIFVAIARSASRQI